MADIKDLAELMQLLAAGWLPDANEPTPAARTVSSDANPHVWTIKDMPHLAEKLREQGWTVSRVADELHCRPRRPWSRVQ
jgi:hypothetical protein